jgi:hypothetical protein
MFLDCIKSFVTDVMLNSAGVFGSSFLVNAYTHEQFGENGVALVNVFGFSLTCLGQCDISVGVPVDVTAFNQQTESTAYRWF